MFSLVRCDADGVPEQPIAAIPDAIAATFAANADLHRRTGYTAPWVSYVAVDAGQAVGGGAFVGPPRDGYVEIAYFTLKECERRSYATRTATELIAIARQAQLGIGIKALTLPQDNASTRILRRLGFAVVGSAWDPDAGAVWEWRSTQ